MFLAALTRRRQSINTGRVAVGDEVDHSHRVGFTPITAVDEPAHHPVEGRVFRADGSAPGSQFYVNTTTGNDQFDPAVAGLSNGNFVVRSPFWNGERGAVTWGSGTTGISGVVSAANSLVGTAGGSNGDQVGSGVTALSNGNYVVRSPFWNNNTGAATWGSGATGKSG